MIIFLRLHQEPARIHCRQLHLTFLITLEVNMHFRKWYFASKCDDDDFRSKTKPQLVDIRKLKRVVVR